MRRRTPDRSIMSVHGGEKGDRGRVIRHTTVGFSERASLKATEATTIEAIGNSITYRKYSQRISSFCR